MWKNRRVLIVAAHPDDEVLGCGGTIARLVMSGSKVFVLFIADGITARANCVEKNLLNRRQAAEKSAEILGIEKLIYLDFPDNQLDSVPILNIIKKIEKNIADILPDMVFTHYSGDLNLDHSITYQAVMTACRPLPSTPVKEIYSFEVMSSTEWAIGENNRFNPNLYVDITEYLEKKQKALIAYNEEMREPPHSRSLDHITVLAKHRGYSVGMQAAEGFVINRIIG